MTVCLPDCDRLHNGSRHGTSPSPDEIKAIAAELKQQGMTHRDISGETHYTKQSAIKEYTRHNNGTHNFEWRPC